MRSALHVYSRNGCCLCEEAMGTVERLAGLAGLDVVEVDIEAAPELRFRIQGEARRRGPAPIGRRGGGGRAVPRPTRGRSSSPAGELERHRLRIPVVELDGEVLAWGRISERALRRALERKGYLR